MAQIPDAPFIREAEQYGMPPFETIECPVCGKECDTLFFDHSGTLCGCERCMTQKDAWEWMEEEKEAGRPDDD